MICPNPAMKGVLAAYVQSINMSYKNAGAQLNGTSAMGSKNFELVSKRHGPEVYHVHIMTATFNPTYGRANPLAVKHDAPSTRFPLIETSRQHQRSENNYAPEAVYGITFKKPNEAANDNNPVKSQNNKKKDSDFYAPYKMKYTTGYDSMKKIKTKQYGSSSAQKIKSPVKSSYKPDFKTNAFLGIKASYSIGNVVGYIQPVEYEIATNTRTYNAVNKNKNKNEDSALGFKMPAAANDNSLESIVRKAA